MSHIRIAPTLAVAVGLLVAQAPSVSLAETIETGIWRGDAYLGPDGRFQHCAVIGDYEGSTDLGFGIDAQGIFEVFLVDQTWTLTPGGAEQVAIQIDGGETATGPFEALQPSMLGTRLVDRPGLVQGFKSGNTVTFRGFFGTVEFPLTGSANAIAALESCVATVSAGIRDGRRLAEAQARLAQVSGERLFELTPRTFAFRVLMDLPPDRFAVPADAEEASRRWRAALVWRVQDGLGRVSTVSGDPSEEDLRSALVEMQGPTCAGELTSLADLRLLPGTDRVVKHVELQCSDTGGGRGAVEATTFYPHASGNLLMISHLAETADAARTADLLFLEQIGRIVAAR